MLPQAFLGGFQTLAAFAIGIGALATVPMIGSTDSLGKKPDSEDAGKEANLSSESTSLLESNTVATNNSSSESDSPLEVSRSIVKSGLVWLFDVVDQTQKFFAESAESFQDLITEAKIEQQTIAQSREEKTTPSNSNNPPAEIQIDD